MLGLFCHILGKSPAKLDLATLPFNGLQVSGVQTTPLTEFAVPALMAFIGRLLSPHIEMKSFETSTFESSLF